MGRPQVGEFGDQISVRTYLIPRYLLICEDSQEGISRPVSSLTVVRGSYETDRSQIIWRRPL